MKNLRVNYATVSQAVKEGAKMSNESYEPEVFYQVFNKENKK